MQSVRPPATRPPAPNQAAGTPDDFLTLFPGSLRRATRDLFTDFAARSCPPAQIAGRAIDFLESIISLSNNGDDIGACRVAIRILRTHRQAAEHYAFAVYAKRRAR